MRKLMSAIGIAAVFASVWRFRSRLCRLLGCDTEIIMIAQPVVGFTISSPVTVSGWGRATQHNQLSVEVRDSANAVVGSGAANVTGALGQPGPFTGIVTFAPGAGGTPGFIVVCDASPATGTVTHLASVRVSFP